MGERENVDGEQQVEDGIEGNGGGNERGEILHEGSEQVFCLFRDTKQRHRYPGTSSCHGLYKQPSQAFTVQQLTRVTKS